MDGWLTQFILFYVAIALIWTLRRYFIVKDRDAWKKDWLLHLVESLGWLFILFRTGYGKETEPEDHQ